MAREELTVTRWRDLGAVGLIAALLCYGLVRLGYDRLPVLPRLAGVAAAVIGVAEAAAGIGLRTRSGAGRRAEPVDGQPRRPLEQRRPLEPLTAARVLAVAKASALAGAALAGLWLGLLVYVAPRADAVAAAHSDTVTAVVGLVGALVMTGGALVLELVCRRPEARR